MQCTINQLYDNLYQKVYDVYGIFTDFFGEEYVDLQKNNTETDFKKDIAYHVLSLKIHDVDYDKVFDIPDDIYSKIENFVQSKRVTIYVWWPQVTVTNENNKSVGIQDLYAKIEIRLDGTIPYENVGFLLNRATYTKEQFLSDYMHSHIQKIPREDFTTFMSPCLGKGPIKETIGTLKNTCNEIMWMLFCQELSMYVTVESIAGVPWKRLESIGATNVSCQYHDYGRISDISMFKQLFSEDILRNFLKYYLKHGHLTISYRNGQYTYGMSYFDYIIDISNSFIDFYNLYFGKSSDMTERCFFNRLLNTVLISNGKFYDCDNPLSTASYNRYIGRHVLKFKGRDICLNILDNVNTDATQVILVDSKFAMYVIDRILKVINYRYINKYHYEYREKRTSDSCKRVYYI